MESIVIVYVVLAVIGFFLVLGIFFAISVVRKLGTVGTAVETLNLKESKKSKKNLSRALNSVFGAFRKLAKSTPIELTSFDQLGNFNLVFKDEESKTWKAYRTDEYINEELIDSLQRLGVDIAVEKILK